MPTLTFFNLPEQKRNKIIDVALVEFAERSYNEASLSRIVRQAGVAKGSIYQYFEDKKDLYLYLIELAKQAKLQYLKEHEAGSSGDFYDRFRATMLIGARWAVTSPRAYLMARVTLRALDSPYKDEIFGDLRKLAAQMSKQMIEQAQRDGDVRLDVAEDIIVFFFNTLTSQFGEFIIERAGLDVAALAEMDDFMGELSKGLESAVDDLMKLVRDGLAGKGGR